MHTAESKTKLSVMRGCLRGPGVGRVCSRLPTNSIVRASAHAQAGDERAPGTNPFIADLLQVPTISRVTDRRREARARRSIPVNYYSPCIFYCRFCQQRHSMIAVSILVYIKLLGPETNNCDKNLNQ